MQSKCPGLHIRKKPYKPCKSEREGRNESGIRQSLMHFVFAHHIPVYRESSFINYFTFLKQS